MLTINSRIKFPKKLKDFEIRNFFSSRGLLKILELKEKKYLYPAKLRDLYRLYQFVFLNKRTTVLEFGSGYSSLIFVHSLWSLKKKFSLEIKKIRRANAFELFILENEKKFLTITKNRIRNFFKNNLIKVHYHFSYVRMIIFRGFFATEYNKLPQCNPDFIYIDGPDQFKVRNKKSGITVAHKDMMPMICDILKFEYFYTPGTIIIVDGRSANAKFLLDNLKRNWLYKNDKRFDQHIFYLDDPVLGYYNQQQINFYKNSLK